MKTDKSAGTPTPQPLAAEWDVIVVGGGPAGLAAAVAAKQNGAAGVLLLERNDEAGGILNQCIHNGFGLHYFKEELTGPEYAERFVKMAREAGVRVLCGAMVLEIGAGRTVKLMQHNCGYLQLRAKAVVLAMGCRERTRGAIGIPGTRPAGVFTAGAAQLYMNIEGYQVGSRAVVLGSGDIGLIMARRLTLEGAKVLGVYELMPYSGGLTRNIVQCLHDYGIPLHLSRTVTEIRGDKRVEQVVVQQVDEKLAPIPGTEEVIDCDTVLLSVGLIPENELSRKAGIAIDARTGGPQVVENMETSLPGVFCCGNVAHVHDLVDFVTAESLKAGEAAARFCVNGPVQAAPGGCIVIENGDGVGYTVPQHIRRAGGGVSGKDVEVYFRVRSVYRKVQIEACCGGVSVLTARREHMAPGEMEKIVLPGKMLENLTENVVTLRIKQEASA